jgi:hypothetical protein
VSTLKERVTNEELRNEITTLHDEIVLTKQIALDYRSELESLTALENQKRVRT